MASGGIGIAGFSHESTSVTHADGTTETITNNKGLIGFVSFEHEKSSNGAVKTAVNLEFGFKLGIIGVPEFGVKIPIVVESIKPKKR